MSKSRLLSGKIKKITGSELDSDRRLFLNLANAEPDLGNPTIDGSILVADIDGTRYWTPSVKVDLTGNIFLGTINSADGSTPIRLTESTIIEGDLTVGGIGNISEIITQTLKSLDSTTITIENNLDVQNNLTVNGNLTVLGSTTTINSTTLTVEDKNIELAKNSTSAETSDGAGITVIGPTTPATITYDALTDTWNFNKTIVGTVQGGTSVQDIDDRINLFFDNDINTTDSSAIVFVPAVEMRSDLTVDNDVSIANNLTVGGIISADTVLVKGTITGIFAGAITGPDAIGLFNQLITQGLTTQDSSPLTVIPALIAQSDVTVENNLYVNNSIVAAKFIGDGSQLSGISTLTSQDVDDRISEFFDNDINTTDSSAIVFVPSVEMRSDLTIDNDLFVNNTVYADRFIGDGSQLTGISTLTSQDVDDRINLFFDEDINTSDSSAIVFVPQVEMRSDLVVDSTVFANKFIGDGSQLTGIVTEVSLDDLTDVDTTTAPPTEGQGLVWDNINSIWRPGSLTEGTAFYTGPTPPLSASQGDFWFDSDRGVLTVYIYDGDSLQWVEVSASGYEGPTGPVGYTGSAGGGANAFTELTDAPASYTNQAGKLVAVNQSANGLEFVESFTPLQFTKSYFHEGPLTVSVGDARLYIHRAVILKKIKANVVAVGTTDAEFVVLKNGVSIQTITIPANQNITDTSDLNIVLNENDAITVDITIASSAEDLYVTLIYEV